jgi:hypothetical protein
MTTLAKPCSRRRWALLPVIALLLPLVSCEEKLPPPLAAQSQPARPAGNLEIRIESVDGQPIAKGGTAEVGRIARLAGSVTDSSATVCALVHPPVMSGWWVQPPPKPLRQAGPGKWQWEGRAWFGSADVGKGDEFEVMALAEPSPGVCAKKGEVPPGEIPASASRSEVLRVKRTKD